MTWTLTSPPDPVWVQQTSDETDIFDARFMDTAVFDASVELWAQVGDGMGDWTKTT